jgi:hypothetical protein
MSKTRYLFQIGNLTYRGSTAIQMLRGYHKEYREEIGSIPQELKNAARPEKAQWIFEHLPNLGVKIRLFIAREARRTRPGKSRYIVQLRNLGHGARLHTKRQAAAAKKVPKKVLNNPKKNVFVEMDEHPPFIPPEEP